MSNNLAILLCTYNGQEFLKEQLDSFSCQTFKSWRLFIYDDCSTDDTKKIVSEYKRSHQDQNKVNWKTNKTNMGFSKNFLNSIHEAPSDMEYYALSDQDDIWCEAKLHKAVSHLDKMPKNIPALYCSRTILTDGTGKKIGMSPLFSKAPSFKNALVQSIAGGNTMVFNNATRDLIIKVSQDIDTVSHDWSIYQLVSGAGGNVYYDSNAEILYRQHEGNIIGSNTGMLAKLSRARMLLAGSFKNWNDKNIELLKKNYSLLSIENQAILNTFVEARKKTLLCRLLGFIKSGIYRQTLADNIALFICGILNKI